MTCIFGAVLSVESSKRIWGLLFSFEGVGRTDELSPFGDGARCDEFHSD